MRKGAAKQMEKEENLILPSAIARVRSKWVRIQGRAVFGGQLNVILRFKSPLRSSLKYRLAKAGRE